MLQELAKSSTLKRNPLRKAAALGIMVRMKWLIIASEGVDSADAVSFLKAQDWRVKQVVLTEVPSEDNVKELLGELSGCSGCVFLAGESLGTSFASTFVMGVLAGRAVSAYIQGEESSFSRFSLFIPQVKSYLRFFGTQNDLLSYLRDNKAAIEDEGRKRACFEQLFKAGISFTADSFEFYLEREKFEICNLILNAGLDVNARTMQGVPLLCVATRADNREMIDTLLALGADVNAVSSDRGYSAVMDAVWRKNYDVTKLLLERGADLSIMSSDGQPILVLAVGNGNAKIVGLLLDAGADPDVKDSMGMSAREYASLFKNEDLVKLMKKVPRKES